MKYLLLLLVLVGFFYVLGARRGRRPDAEAAPRAPQPAPAKSMAQCAECGVHLPADDALPGRGGVFCSAAHRAAYEARDAA